MADLPALPARANEHRVIIIYLFLVCFLLAHFSRWLRLYEPRVVLAFLALLMIVGAFGFVAFMFEPVDIGDVFLFLAVWGIALYIFLCEVLLQGGAQWLTKRGEKWVKELDYFYLAFRSGGNTWFCKQDRAS
jgi:hypothetical protein